MIKVECCDIIWNTDLEELPSNTIIELEEDDNFTVKDLINERAADVLADEHGWCVESFTWRLVEEPKTVTAHNVAADPDLYNIPVIIGRNSWECMGYSKTEKTIRFARLVVTENGKLRQINKYVSPDLEVILEKEMI